MGVRQLLGACVSGRGRISSMPFEEHVSPLANKRGIEVNFGELCVHSSQSIASVSMIRTNIPNASPVVGEFSLSRVEKEAKSWKRQTPLT